MADHAEVASADTVLDLIERTRFYVARGEFDFVEFDRIIATLERLDEAESALRSALEDCHPSVELYFKRHPDADTALAD